MKKILLLCMALFAGRTQAGKFENLAMTPPMGWNTWNKFACNVDEKLIRQTADAIVSSGLKDAGYSYVVIDDCWHGERDEQGFIHPDAKRFPSGIKALSDYVHAKGLKLGIYSDAGWKTCGGRPGSRGYEYQDAFAYASWGVDYLKYDWCNTDKLNAEGAYTTMREALKAAGRPIVFSLCEWGQNKPWEWAKDVGQLWRTTGDIYPCFDCEKKYGDWSAWGAMRILDRQVDLRKYAGPGHWNDPDMLEVGNGMSASEDRAHFSMWCMLAAPLMMGHDISNMSKVTKEILTNRLAIAIDQDALGIQGFKLMGKNGIEIWFKPLDQGAWAVCFLNRSEKSKKIEWDWSTQSVKDDMSGRDADFAHVSYALRDVWSGKAWGSTRLPLNAKVPSHDVLMLRLDSIQK
jgi:alpha-galactosidase